MHSKALFSRLMKICPVEEPAKPTFSRVRMLPRRLSLSRAHLQIWGLGSRKGSVGLQSLDSLSVRPRYADEHVMLQPRTESWTCIDRSNTALFGAQRGSYVPLIRTAFDTISGPRLPHGLNWSLWIYDPSPDAKRDNENWAKRLLNGLPDRVKKFSQKKEGSTHMRIQAKTIRRLVYIIEIME